MTSYVRTVGRISLAICVSLAVDRVALAQVIDPSFNPGANAPTRALAIQPDGKILIGGDFTLIGGAGSSVVSDWTARRYLARFNPDGSVDNTFDPEPDEPVQTIAVQPDGKIIIGGHFAHVGASRTVHDSIARLNADGSVDQTFRTWAVAGVRALALQPDGKILVGGGFRWLSNDGINTIIRTCIARLNSDGTVDEGFDAGLFLGNVSTLLLQPDGRIVVGGVLTPNGGPTRYLMRLNADGSRDNSFTVTADADVRAIVGQPDGKTVVGGYFSTLSDGTGTYPRRWLGRLNADGTIDSGFNPNIEGAVETLALQTDGKLVIGRGLTRLMSDGSVDPSFDANPGVDGLVIQKDGRILCVGGFFTLSGGGTTASRWSVGRLINTEETVDSLTVTDDGGVVHWRRSGPGPELSRTTFEYSLDGVSFTNLGAGVRTMPDEWQLGGVHLPQNQSFSLRARGYFSTGYTNGSESIVESVQWVNGPQWHVVVAADFNGDSTPDLVWQHDTTRQVAVAFMGGAQGAALLGTAWLSSAPVPGWRVIAATDLNGDGHPDLVWQNDATRQVTAWYLGGAQGTNYLGAAWLNASPISNWRVVAVADFNADGHPDLVWQHDTTRQVTLWFMTGLQSDHFLAAAWLSQNPIPDWRIVAAADFDAEGHLDLVWQHDTTRQASVWYLGGAQGITFVTATWLSFASIPSWRIVAAADLNIESHPDLVWQHDNTRQVTAWYMGGPQGNTYLTALWLAQTVPSWGQ